MSDLLGSLSVAARSLDAQALGLQVTGDNIANVNTPGFARRTVDFAEVPPDTLGGPGNGVDVVAIRAERDAFIEAQLRYEQPTQAREQAIADSLSRIQAALGDPGSSLDAVLTQFYNAFGALAQDPTSAVARQQVVVQGQLLATTFHDVDFRLTSAQQDADAQVRASVDQINALGAQIASLNAKVSGAGGAANESARDQLNQALRSLSQLIDIGVVMQADGSATVSVGNGRALVVGSNAYQLGVAPRAGTGFVDITAGGFVITGEVTGGALGGFLQVRDVLLTDYRSRLDDLAYGVATSVNAAHAAGYDLSGNPGGDFFVPPTAVAGAAQSLSVSAAIAANPNLVAAASTPSPGDNGNARAIAALADAPLAGINASPVDAWAGLVYRVGTDAQVAAAERSMHDQVVQQLEKLRDQTSGVSLDEEGANLVKFQRAYEANARFFSAVQTSLDVLMQMVGT